jgi:hypothetical protein
MTQTRSADPGWARLAAAAVAVVIVAHSLAHLMGVALLGEPGGPGKPRYADVVPAAGMRPARSACTAHQRYAARPGLGARRDEPSCHRGGSGYRTAAGGGL